ncbi:MAG: helix-turn-helix domain-containing protein [Erysipelotrichaceae bacterium]|jgi:transcriptional regulator with XRE-family HTH domain|nr:helix-turn-helix domain-containing protein [Erysipelotrichaceae bacterium]
MGRKSTKDNKNIYQLSREEAGLTRMEASGLTYLSESVIEKIEYGTSKPDPDAVVAMAKAYKKPELCNYYCSHECAIGDAYVPEVKISSLSEIVLHMLASLNSLEKQKDRLIEITVDGEITADELADFASIQKMLNRISLSADAMRLWLEKSIASGHVDEAELRRLLNEEE